MSTTTQITPTSRLRFGLARVDVTPPVGVYHRMWGAARHDRATGIHRPLTAEALFVAPIDEGEPAMLRVQIDLVGLPEQEYQAVTQAASEGSGVPARNVVVTFSHTHAAGLMSPDRVDLPGGDKIPPYLEDLKAKIRRISREAREKTQPATITYGSGRCDLAANRDYWDEARQIYACGFNPDAAADDTLLVARVTDAEDNLLATLVHYGCHPTTLAWENTQISPDYVGALREMVERATDAPCVFFLGACGDLGPREGFVGDAAVADRNGRQLGYAALSTLSALGPSNNDFRYQGPVVSGATVGTWAYEPLSVDRRTQVSRFGGGAHTVDLPLKEKPDVAKLRADRDLWEARQAEAEERGDRVAARDARALAERARRWLMRLESLPDGTTYAFPYTVYRLGDAFWVTCGGEPYNWLQVELRRRFPEHPIWVSPLASGMQVAYLLPRDRYGKGLYQEEPSILAPGCLEMLADAIAARIDTLRG